MQDVQFERLVLDSAPPELPRPIVKLVISDYVKTGRAERRYITDCIELAGRISEAMKADAPAERLGIFDIGPIPETTITEGVLIDQLKAEVKELRLEIFGRHEAPFSEYAQALEWIEKEAQADRRRIGYDLAKLLALFDKLRKLLGEMSDAMGRPVSARIETPLMRYYKPHAGIRGIKVRLGSKLLPLHAFAQSAESTYGFSEHELIAYALTNTHPRLTRITIGTEIGTDPRPPKTTITILARQPCWEDLRRAYHLIQQETRRKRARRLDDEDYAVISAIRKYGGVPKRKGSQEFWERVGKEVGMSPGAARMRFRRLPEDLRAEVRTEYGGAEQA